MIGMRLGNERYLLYSINILKRISVGTGRMNGAKYWVKPVLCTRFSLTSGNISASLRVISEEAVIQAQISISA